MAEEKMLSLDKIKKELETLQAEFQVVDGDKSRIDNEIKVQTELLAKAKQDRDAASDTGDEAAWKAAMKGIAAANSKLGELKAERQKLKSGASKLSEGWGPLNKACGPLREDIAHKRAALDEQARDVEKRHGSIMGFAGQISELNRQL